MLDCVEATRIAKLASEFILASTVGYCVIECPHAAAKSIGICAVSVSSSRSRFFRLWGRLGVARET